VYGCRSQMRTHWGGIILAWLAYWSALPAHALDIPRPTDLPYELTEQQELIDRRPQQCVAKVDEFLTAQKNNADGQLEASWLSPQNQPKWIGLWQLKAACLAKSERAEEALQALDYAYQLATGWDLPIHQAHILLSQSLIYRRLYVDMDTANRRLDQAQQLLEGAASPMAIPLRAELEVQRCELMLAGMQLLNAKVCLTNALDSARHANKPSQISRLLLKLGDYYRLAKQSETALYQYIEAKTLAEDNQLKSLQGLANLRLAQMHLSQGQSTAAIENANLAAQQFQELNNNEQLLESLRLLGEIHERGNEPNMALVYYFNALDIARDLGQTQSSSALYLKMGKSYMQMDNLTLAKKYLDGARHLTATSNNHQQQTETLTLLGELRLRQHQADRAMPLLEEALAIATQHSNQQARQTLYKLLARSHEMQQHYEQALNTYKAYVALFEQHNTPRENKTQDQFNQQYQLVDQHEQIDRLTRQNNSIMTSLQQTRLYTGVMLGVCILFGLMWFRNRVTLNATNDLLQKEQYRLTHHPLSELPNRRALIQWLFQESEQQQELLPIAPDDYGCDYQYSLLLFELPMLEQAGLQHGHEFYQQLCKSLGQRLTTEMAIPNKYLYQLGKQRLLLVLHHEYQACGALVEQASRSLRQLAQEHQLNEQCYCGVIETPFLTKAPDAIEPDKLIQIGELALFGARQLAQGEGNPNWVRLHTISSPQGAFFSGEIWRCCIRAIQSGIIKVECSGDKYSIVWPEPAKAGSTDQGD